MSYISHDLMLGACWLLRGATRSRLSLRELAETSYEPPLSRFLMELRGHANLLGLAPGWPAFHVPAFDTKSPGHFSGTLE